MQNVSLKKNII